MPARKGHCQLTKLVDNHPLGREFPEYREAITRLKTGNAHFARLMHEHEAVDRAVVRAEQGIDHLSANNLEALKMKRVHLKDELYQMLQTAT